MGRPKLFHEGYVFRMKPDLHYLIKVQSSIERMNASEFIVKLVEDYLKDKPITKQIVRKAIKKK